MTGITDEGAALREDPFARERALLESPKLIIEWDGDTATSATCSVCRAIFPTLEEEGAEEEGAEANRRLLERVFQVHVKAEHSDQALPWESAQGNLQ